MTNEKILGHWKEFKKEIGYRIDKDKTTKNDICPKCRGTETEIINGLKTCKDCGHIHNQKAAKKQYEAEMRHY